MGTPADTVGLMPDLPMIDEVVPVPPKTVADPGAVGGRRGRSFGIGLGLILSAGLAARLALSFRDGHRFDVDIFLHWMRSLWEHGLGGFYAAAPGCNYPPLYLLALRGLGWILAWFDPGLAHDEALRAALRGPACVADLLIAILLFAEARRLLGPRAGLAAAALYFLNPVALYNSAYWGQVDSVHSLFVLVSLAALNRGNPGWAGAAIALALLQKLQAVAFVPLVLLDIFQRHRWRGLLRWGAGAAAAAGVVLAPFIRAGVLPSAMERGYVRVIGQYDKLSYNAFNLWRMLGIPEAPDDAIPPFLVNIAAGEQLSVRADESRLLSVTWRRMAIALCGLAMALALAIHSRRPAAVGRSLTAGVLGLAFFVFLTEMHERYAFTVIAVLPIWAVSGAWRERAFVLLSAAMLLNLTVAQPVEEIGGDLGALHLLLLGAFLLALAAPAVGGAPAAGAAAELPRAATPEPAESSPQPALVVWFRRLVWAGVVAAVGIAGLLAFQYHRNSAPTDPNHLYLSQLPPIAVAQSYGRLANDRSVEGEMIRLGDTFFLRGLGTHAPSKVDYDVPEGYTLFHTWVGVNRHFDGRVRVEVQLDGKTAFSSPTFTAADAPLEIHLPLNGARRLRLTALPLHERKGDHVDWALARFER